MEISQALLIAFVSEMFAGAIVIWRFAAAWGGLKQADRQNHIDINALGRKVRRHDQYSWQRLNNIEEFLRETQNYNPPTLNPYEDDR